MERTELLESLLEVSTNEYYAHQLKDELGRYFNVMTGVVVESANLLSPQNLASDRMFQLSVKCLINFCANKDLARLLFDCSKQERREKLLASLTSFYFSGAGEEARLLTFSLLVNLTTLVEWAGIFCDASYTEVICRKIATKRRPPCIELKLLLNLTSVRRMRQSMCNDRIHLSSLVSLLPKLQDTASRLTIAGILKNCCFEEECHGRLCYLSDDMLVTALLVLCDVSDAIEDEDRCTLPPPIREAYDSKTAKRESDALVKTTICEALLQLCSTKTGRQYLRSLGVYFILREMHRHECAVEQNLVGIEGGNELQTQKNLVFVVDQVVDQLICEESERPKDYSSLRDVPIDKETEEKLNKAKVAYINST
uniref:Protein HGH1 homolog n=1 Tax=Echinococcus granulosus TaxID=6210 RepID=A0A068WZK6_ECHGR|nr:FAM203 family protein GA19338 [Echinococcus granulosus]